jgi:hypothetical protein
MEKMSTACVLNAAERTRQISRDYGSEAAFTTITENEALTTFRDVSSLDDV